MTDKEMLLKELEFIQNIIERQANNQFRIKGWTVALVVVALLFRSDGFQFLIAFIPLFGFWILDAYYLRLERLYRELYDHVRRNAQDPERDVFNMDVSDFSEDVKPIQNHLFANSIGWFYGSIAILLVVYGIFLSLVWIGTLVLSQF